MCRVDLAQRLENGPNRLICQDVGVTGQGIRTREQNLGAWPDRHRPDDFKQRRP